jgi:hypothetical protein
MLDLPVPLVVAAAQRRLADAHAAGAPAQAAGPSGARHRQT